MSPRPIPLLLAGLLGLSLAGCALGPDYRRPAASLPENYPEALASPSAAVDADWWRLFQDPLLDDLIEQGRRNNADLRLAVARVDQANALAREAGASFLPQIDGTVSGSDSQASTRTAIFNPAMPTRRRAHAAGLATAFELDVWGRIRRANEAASAGLLASQYGRDAIRLTVSAAIADTYLGLRALDAQLALTADTLRTRQDSARLARTRVDAGLVSPVDAHLAESALAAAEAQAAQQRRLRALAGHQLALLTGNPALTVPTGDLAQLPLPPQPPAGLPAQLVEQRPDVRKAEQELIASNAGIAIARAAYFPKFTLTGSYGSESRALADLFTAGATTWSLGLAAMLPILDFGRTAARVDQARAVNQQSLIAWENTLQTAYKEVRDALVNLREFASEEAAQATRVDRAGQALALARLRYGAGAVGYLEVLEAERSANEARLAAVASRQARLSASVALFKALGGGWQAGTAVD